MKVLTAPSKLGFFPFLRTVGKVDYHPAIFCLQGQESYLHELVLRKLEGQYLDAEFRDFNYRRLDCTKATPFGEVAGLLCELPMLVEHRVLFLHNIGALSKDTLNRLAQSWLKDFAPSTVLVVSYWGAGKDNLWWQSLIQKGIVIDCVLDAAGVQTLLSAYARKMEVALDPSVVSCLQSRVGGGLRTLISHLERCLASLKPGETLSPSRIEQLVPFSVEVALWKLTAAIGQKDHGQALEILDYQLNRGETPSAILGYLQSYLISLIQTAGLYEELGSAAAVASVLIRKKEYQVKKTLQELRTWSQADLRAAVESVLRADYKSKGGEGGASPRLLLQMLILNMCLRRGQRP